MSDQHAGMKSIWYLVGLLLLAMGAPGAGWRRRRPRLAAGARHRARPPAAEPVVGRADGRRRGDLLPHAPEVGGPAVSGIRAAVPLPLRRRAAGRPLARPGQPDRRAHRLQRGVRPARRRRPGDHLAVAAERRQPLPPARHRSRRGARVRSSTPSRRSGRGWPNYLLGVVDQLRRRGIDVPGFDCAFGGDIPLGAGMSSSAAIAAGLRLRAQRAVRPRPRPRRRSPGSPRRPSTSSSACAAASWTSSSTCSAPPATPSSSIAARSRTSWCRSPFADVRIVAVRHRRQARARRLGVQPPAAAVRGGGGRAAARRTRRSARCATSSPGSSSAHGPTLDPVVYRRCRYVLDENAACCCRMRRPRARRPARRSASGCTPRTRGLRDDYEVSCPELDALVELARPLAGRARRAHDGRRLRRLHDQPRARRRRGRFRERRRAGVSPPLRPRLPRLRHGDRRRHGDCGRHSRRRLRVPGASSRPAAGRTGCRSDRNGEARGSDSPASAPPRRPREDDQKSESAGGG